MACLLKGVPKKAVISTGAVIILTVDILHAGSLLKKSLIEKDAGPLYTKIHDLS